MFSLAKAFAMPYIQETMKKVGFWGRKREEYASPGSCHYE
jgi:hypothetical protein